MWCNIFYKYCAFLKEMLHCIIFEYLNVYTKLSLLNFVKNAIFLEQQNCCFLKLNFKQTNESYKRSEMCIICNVCVNKNTLVLVFNVYK